MIKTTLLAAAALSFVALGAPTADAKGGHGNGGGGGHGAHNGGQGKHGGSGKHGGKGHHGGYGKHGGHGKHGGGHGYRKSHKYNKSNYFWLNYSWFPSRCHYEPERYRLKVWDRRGNAYFKWATRDVKVCF